jgi:glycerol-3-phosphate acyltransferase PlsY
MILLYLILTYFISSIPFGLVIAKIFSNKNLRQEGSKNIGATNVARVLGKKLAVLVFFLDGLKGYIPVVLVPFFFENHSSISTIIAITGLIAVCGHVFSIYLKLQGGKGVSTTVAILFAVDFRLGLIFSATWLLVFFIKRISSLSALTATLLMPFVSVYLQKSLIEIIILLVIASLIFFKHKKNIKRLLDGSEKQ